MNTLTETQDCCAPTGVVSDLPAPGNLLIKIGRDCLCMVAVVAFAAMATLILGLEGSRNKSFAFPSVDASRPAASCPLETYKDYNAFAPCRTGASPLADAN